MRLKKGLVFAAGTIVALTLAGGQNAVAQEKTHKAATFISGGPTGTWYPTAAAVSEMVNSHYDGQPVSTIPGKGAIGNPLAVGANKAEFGLSYGPFLKLAYVGDNEVFKNKGFDNLRAVANVVANTVHLVLAGDVDIDVLSKLKDGATVSIGVGQKGSSNHFAIEKILMEYGYNYETLEAQGSNVVEGAQQGLVDAFQNRQLDIYTNTVGMNSNDLRQAITARSGKVLALPDPVLEKMVAKWGYVPSVIPAGTYDGQDEPVKSLNLSTIIFTTADMDDEIVYLMVKEMAENHERLIAAYAGFKQWKPEDLPVGHPIPTHPGAVKYYKERGWM
ncbi:TAXI family TRAP transporter solute-binding subunit [Pelagibius sp. CAU 1746]|uniref:TAXI family TRAP transporter solute-binding subunit n=1 Tax=Pelagibius sp. CAU 1746 TaxID=3140370 RepID=UPI00325A4634